MFTVLVYYANCHPVYTVPNMLRPNELKYQNFSLHAVHATCSRPSISLASSPVVGPVGPAEGQKSPVT